MPVETITEMRQYLTFKLGDEIFALDVAKVREVLDFTSVTRVPRTPEFMRGVINLRGSVVPVVDLRLTFGMTGTQKTVNTCIVVVEVALDGESVVVGALGGFGGRGDRSGAGSDRTSAHDWSERADRVYSRNRKAGVGLSDHLGHRRRILSRGARIAQSGLKLTGPFSTGRGRELRPGPEWAACTPPCGPARSFRQGPN